MQMPGKLAAFAAVVGLAACGGGGGDGGGGDTDWLYPLWVETDVALADVDADGRADVVTLAQYATSASQREGRLIVHRQTAPGVFAPGDTYVVGTYPWRFEAADIDGDGRVDFVVTDADDAGVYLLQQNPANPGSLLAPRRIAGIEYPYDLAVADLDGDALPDIAVACALKDSSRVVLLYQDPARRGSFRPAVNFAVPGTASSGVAAGDLNGDGRTDLLMAIAQAHTGYTPQLSLGVSLQQPDGSLGAATLLAPQTGLNVQTLAVADYDGDGRKDLLAYFTPFSTDFRAKLTVVLSGTEAGTFRSPVDTALGDLKGLDDAVFADLDADGRPDAAVAGFFPVGSPSTVYSRLNLFTQAGNGAFALTSSRDLSVTASRLAAGDIDQDRRNELVALGSKDKFLVIEP